MSQLLHIRYEGGKKAAALSMHDILLGSSIIIIVQMFIFIITIIITVTFHILLLLLPFCYLLLLVTLFLHQTPHAFFCLNLGDVK